MLANARKFKSQKMLQNVNFSKMILKSAKFVVSQKRSYLEWTNKMHFLDRWSDHEELKTWVKQKISLFQPARVHLCDGTQQEYDQLIRLQIYQGSMIRLNPEIRPNSYLVRSDKDDVARLEEQTFICSDSVQDSGPTNNWKDPMIATNEINRLFENSMRGRTMYVIPFCMGPFGSPLAKIGVQVTDSPYVAMMMRIMTRMGSSALRALGKDKEFIPCSHSLGMPLGRGAMNSPWPCNSVKNVLHFPEQLRIFSFGSGYGGNALLGKKCFALRIASSMAREAGWLAEHMLIVGVTNPQGIKKYFAAAFPSACGKTNMAMMLPNLKGWKIECVGDDIAWMRIDPNDGRLYAINPEAGLFGVAPGTAVDTNPHAIEGLKKDTVFTNVGLTFDGDVWWEGMSKKVPDRLITWLRTEWTNDDSTIEAAHPNSRFCCPIVNCPVLDPEFNNPKGVPIEAIIFGGRRSNTIPLVFQSKNWQHGVFIGSTMCSETTAAAAGRRGVLRVDPFAMKPFCGYNMADYFSHWLSIPEHSSDKSKLPKFFHVNWFRKRANKIVWPGFGDNIRILKWIFERCDAQNDDNCNETAVGLVPKPESLDVSKTGLSISDLEFLLQVDHREYKSEVTRFREFYSIFSKDKVPKELIVELDELASRVSKPNKNEL